MCEPHVCYYQECRDLLVVFVLRLPIVVGQCFSIAPVNQFFGVDGSLFSMGLVGLL